MNWLAIDTSTEKASVALSLNGAVTSHEHVGARTHALGILPSIQALITDANVALNELDGIVFGRGPGSFTGVRVACSIAKGLAYAHNLPLYPVSTLEAIVESAHFAKRNVAVEGVGCLAVIDARMNQVYWAYATQAAQSIGREQVSDVKDIVVPGDDCIHLLGVGWEHYEQQWALTLNKRIVQRTIIYPEAAAMIRLVARGLITPVSADEALPVYVRDKVTS